MKRIKKFMALFLALGLFAIGLASCTNSRNITFGNDETSSTPTVINPVDHSGTNDSGSVTDNKNTNVNTPELVSLSYVINEKTIDEASSSASTEDVVEELVDACVSITAKSTLSVSRGAGVLFSYDNELGFSYIVTCFHVIEGYSNYTVTDDSGNEYDAYLVGGYKDEDLAVLAIKKTGLKYVDILTDSDTLKRGADVICIGNPLGTLPNSVSKGVVSYVNRVIQQTAYSYRTLIQTDVAINSGNSGGGLFNKDGLLIGIVSNKYSSSSIDNLGFAVPSKSVLSTIKSILNTAKYDKANDTWQTGYVLGDFEFAFTISLGQQSKSFWQYTYVIYISDMEENETYSGASSLEKGDIINSITVKYQDTSKENTTYTVSNITSSTVTEIMTFLENAGLKIGDTLSFNVTRNNETKDIEFSIVQFNYSI